MRDFWTEQGPADILAKLQRKEITLFRAAEQLNVTPQTLSNYLLSLHQGADSNDLNPGQQFGYDGYEEVDTDDETDHLSMPDAVMMKASGSRNNLTTSVLQNHPDITIIKKEKKDDNKMNNNSDHSEALSEDADV